MNRKELTAISTPCDCSRRPRVPQRGRSNLLSTTLGTPGDGLPWTRSKKYLWGSKLEERPTEIHKVQRLNCLRRSGRLTDRRRQAEGIDSIGSRLVWRCGHRLRPTGTLQEQLADCRRCVMLYWSDGILNRAVFVPKNPAIKDRERKREKHLLKIENLGSFGIIIVLA